MKRFRFHIIAFLFLALGCRERFEDFDFKTHTEKLVIEAILTDDSELGYIRVSYTEPVNGNEIRDISPEDAASVKVADDQGNEWTFFSEGAGLYANRNFTPDYGTRYRMQVQVGGNQYESDWQQLLYPEAPPQDVQFRPDTVQVLNDVGRPVNGLAVTLSDKVVKRADNSYYYWQFNYFYIYEAYGQPDVLHLLPEAERFCYVQEHDLPDLTIHDDLGVADRIDTEYRLDVASVPFGRKMIYDFSVQVIRYSVPEDIYNYLRHIENQLDNAGGVFDAAPFSIEGNWTRISGEMDVLGYFGVFNVASQRIFFNQDELPFRKLSLPTDAVSCPGHHAVDMDNTCFNCTAVAAPFNSVEKPAWWR